MDNGASRTPEQIEAANRYQSYVRGWKDGAATKVKRDEFRGHRLEDIYEQGYNDGAGAYARAVAAAQEVWGHMPSVLRSGG